jgi:hypothetical protein
MANAFKSTGANTIGLTKTTVYTAPALTTTTIIGLSAANILTTETTVKVDVILGKGANEYYIVRGAPILPGGALIAVGGDQKLVLEAGNTVKVVSSIAASVDVTVSVLEVS